MFVLVPVLSPSPHTIKGENPYGTVLASWASQEEADTDSSNEEEDTDVSPAPPGVNGPMEAGLVSNLSSNTDKYVYSAIHY